MALTFQHDLLPINVTKLNFSFSWKNWKCKKKHFISTKNRLFCNNMTLLMSKQKAKVNGYGPLFGQVMILKLAG